MPADDSAQGKAGGRSMEAAAPVCGRCIPRVKDTADRHFIQCGTAASPELTDPEDKRRIGYIQAEAERMKELVEELLFLARSDAGRLTAEKTHLDLSFLIESCALNFEPVAFDQGKLKAEFRERYPVYRNQSGYAVYKRRAEAGI